MKSICLSLAILLSSLVSAQVGTATTEDFSGGAIPEGWTSPKGEWVVAGGAMSGKELKADEHGAVFLIPDAHVDSNFTCRFQLNGAKRFGLSYNHAKGHLFRIGINRNGATLSLDKDKKDPASKPIHFAKAKIELKPKQWYTLSCTVKGDTVHASVADAALSGTHEKLKLAKTGYRFVCSGESVLIDDVSFSSSK